jgi:8-oxo-dGTP diphosphatase
MTDPSTQKPKPRVLVAARALVMHRDHVLLLRGRDGDREYHFLPGGGVRHGESLEEACAREVQEECNLEVRVVKPLYLREFIASRHNRLTRGMPKQHHVLAMVFLCEVTGEQADCSPHELGRFTRDKGAVGVEGIDWIPQEEATKLDLMPPQLKDALANDLQGPGNQVAYWPEDPS